jgi:hypothetical protein
MPTNDVFSDGGHLRIIDIATGVVRHTIDFAGSEFLVEDVDVVVTPNSATALMPTGDVFGARGHLRIIDIATGVVRQTIDFTGTENLITGVDVVVTPNSATALMPTSDALRIIDIATGMVRQTINFAGSEFLVDDVDVVVTLDGATALMPTNDVFGPGGHLRIIDVATGAVNNMINFAGSEFLVDGVDVVLTIDPNTVLMPTNDVFGPGGHLRIIDITTGVVNYMINFAGSEFLVTGVDAVSNLSASGRPVSLELDEDFPQPEEIYGIPVVSVWGLIAMVLLFLMVGVIAIRLRRRVTASR